MQDPTSADLYPHSSKSLTYFCLSRGGTGCSFKAAGDSVGFLPKTTLTSSWCHRSRRPWGITVPSTGQCGYQQFLPAHCTDFYLRLRTGRPVLAFLSTWHSDLVLLMLSGMPCGRKARGRQLSHSADHRSGTGPRRGSPLQTSYLRHN